MKTVVIATILMMSAFAQASSMESLKYVIANDCDGLHMRKAYSLLAQAEKDLASETTGYLPGEREMLIDHQERAIKNLANVCAAIKANR
jgi:hypothetical protein